MWDADAAVSAYLWDGRGRQGIVVGFCAVYSARTWFCFVQGRLVDALGGDEPVVAAPNTGREHQHDATKETELVLYIATMWNPQTTS